MLRVFLVEDESIIRETLRDTVPWAQYGYTFAGEAGDGEMALIRQVKPDVLITDVRMPFMDGLDLSELVRRRVETAREQYAACAPEQSWYAAIGCSTQRLSTLPACFEEVSRLWACRHILPQLHVLSADSVSFLTGTGGGNSQLDASKVDPAILLGVTRDACVHPQ